MPAAADSHASASTASAAAIRSAAGSINPTRAAPMITSAGTASSASSRPSACAFSRHERWTSVQSKSIDILLPDPGYQPVDYLRLVLAIAGQTGGMPHEGIRACRNHFLVGRQFNGRRRKRVLAVGAEDQIETEARRSAGSLRMRNSVVRTDAATSTAT